MVTKNRSIGKVLHVTYLIATGGCHLLNPRSTKLYFPLTRIVHCSTPLPQRQTFHNNIQHLFTFDDRYVRMPTYYIRKARVLRSKY